MCRSKARDAGGLTPAKDDNAAEVHFIRLTLPFFKCFDYKGYRESLRACSVSQRVRRDAEQTLKGQIKGNCPKNSKEKALHPLGCKAFLLAAGEGFEPSHTESESAVLPLHNPAKFITNNEHYTHLGTFVKC